MERLRASWLAKRIIGAALAVWGGVHLLWQAIGIVSQLEWIVTHLPHNAVAWLQERFQTGIAAVSWSLLLNIFLLAIGITLVIISFRESKAASRPLPLDPERPPKPRKKIDPKEVIKIVERLLLRFLKEGQALIGGVDAKLLIDWETRTAAFIRGVYRYSEDEVKRFYSNDGYSVISLEDQLQVRIERIKQLGRRLEFTPVREDFDPDMWKDY